MNKIFIYARLRVNKMTWTFFFFFLPGSRVSVLLGYSAVFLLFEILGPDPTSNKNKAEKNS